MDILYIPNLEKWQHYKDRTPPWIKLHRDLLRDYKFSCLQDASKAHLMLFWLLASQMDNVVPYDKNFIKQQLGINNDIDLDTLVSLGFIGVGQDDSVVLAGCNQNAMREKEAEAEAEEDKKKNIKKKKNGTRLSEDWVATDEYINFALSEGLSIQQANSQADQFKDYWIARSDKGAIKKDWLATWRNWIRNNKGKINDRNSSYKNTTQNFIEGFTGRNIEDFGRS